jgi:hypothetical protein
MPDTREINIIQNVAPDEGCNECVFSIFSISNDICLQFCESIIAHIQISHKSLIDTFQMHEQFF